METLEGEGFGVFYSNVRVQVVNLVENLGAVVTRVVFATGVRAPVVQSERPFLEEALLAFFAFKRRLGPVRSNVRDVTMRFEESSAADFTRRVRLFHTSMQ